MAASNRHRRLMEDYTNTAATNPFCKLQCDPQHNPTGICFTFCAADCPSFCRISYWSADSAPPSSSPSPATSPRSQTAAPSGSNTQIPFPLKISLLFFVGTFVYTLYKFYTAWDQSRRHRMAPPPSPEIQETGDNEGLDHPIWHIKTAGLQLSVVNAITVVKFNKGDGVVVGTDCSVCLTEFEADDTLRLLPNCKHAFHISCIDTWLQSHTNCPLCRAGIVDAHSPEQSTDDLGVTAETDSRISVMEDDDREQVSESSGLSIGEPNEDYLNRNGDLFQIRRLVSVEDFAASGHREMQSQSVDGDSRIELVKLEQKTDNNSPN